MEAFSETRGKSDIEKCKMHRSISQLNTPYSMDRINNAYFSRFRKPVAQRVACLESMQLYSPDYTYRWAVCNRQKSAGARLMSREFCEILGPDLCSDCIKSRDRILSAYRQRCYFPNAGVYPRSVSAPPKFGRLQHPEHRKTNTANFSPSSLNSEQEYDIHVYSVCSVDDLLKRLRKQHTMYKSASPANLKVQQKKPAIRFDDKKKLINYTELLNTSPPMI